MLTFSLVLASLIVEGQQAGKVYRIGVLTSQTPTTLTPVLNAFNQKLRDLGYAEGRNLAIEHRGLMADMSGFPLWRES